MDKIRQLNISMPKLDLRNMQRRSMNDIPEQSSKVKIIKIIFFVVALLFLAAITIYAYFQTKPVTNILDLPLVERELSSLRTQPSQPGGLIISNQNKAIYRQLKKNDSSTSHVSESSQAQVRAMVEKYFSKPKESEVIVSDDAVVGNIDSTEPDMQHVKHNSDIFALIPKEKSNIKSDNAKLRIAVLKTHAEADKEWTRLSKKIKFLQNEKHRITEKIAKNGNKMFYLWIINLTADSGKDLCEKLKQNNQECFIIYE